MVMEPIKVFLQCGSLQMQENLASPGALTLRSV